MMDFHYSTWGYRIEPTETGCKVTEWSEDLRPQSVLEFSEQVSGVAERTGRNRNTMSLTLDRLAAALERADPAGAPPDPFEACHLLSDAEVFTEPGYRSLAPRPRIRTPCSGSRACESPAKPSPGSAPPGLECACCTCSEAQSIHSICMA